MAKGHGALIFDNLERERVGVQSPTLTTIVTPKAEEKECLPTPPMLVPNDSHEPLFMRLRRRLHWWQAHATPQVVRLIRHGLPADWVFPPPHQQFPHVVHSQQEIQDALKLMEEYLGVYAVRLRSGASQLAFVVRSLQTQTPFHSQLHSGEPLSASSSLLPPSQLGHHLSFSCEGPLGNENRPQARLLPSRSGARSRRPFEFSNRI